MRLQASLSACSRCPRQAQCGLSFSPRFAKEVRLGVDPLVAEELKNLVEQERQRRFWSQRALSTVETLAKKDAMPSPRQTRTHLVQLAQTDLGSGPFATCPPLLLPKILRSTFTNMTSHVAVSISLKTPRPGRGHPALAHSAAERHRRRQCWVQHNRHMSLPARASIDIEYRDSSGKLAAWLTTASNPSQKVVQHAAAS